MTDIPSQSPSTTTSDSDRASTPRILPSPIPSTFSAPPRKRKKQSSDSAFNKKCEETFKTINGIVANHIEGKAPKAPDVTQSTLSVISGYMSVLPENRKKAFAAKVINLIRIEPPLTEDDIA